MMQGNLDFDGQGQTPAPETTAPATTEQQQPAAPAAETKKKAAKKEGGKPISIFEAVLYLQQNVKVGKNSINEGDPGNPGDSFAFRTLEDILVGLKPVLKEIGCILTIPFVPTAIGNYIFCTATARLENAAGESKEVSASAMMNTGNMANKFPSQEALACGTMARKSALAGLLLLDDTTAEQQGSLVPRDIDSVPKETPAFSGRKKTAAAPAAPAAKAAASAPEKKEEKIAAAPQAEKPAAQIGNALQIFPRQAAHSRQADRVYRHGDDHG